MLPPQPLRWGPKKLRTWLNNLLGFSRQSRIVNGDSYTVHEQKDGTQLVFPPANSGAISGGDCPLGLYDASDEDGAKLGVTWGTIQGRQPTGFAAGGDPAFIQAVEGSFYVYANATFDLDTLQATAAQLVINTNPFLANTTTDAYQMIGSGVVSDDGKSVAVESVCGNVVFDPCTLVPSS